MFYVVVMTFIEEWRHVLLHSTSRHIGFVRSSHCALLSLRLWGAYAHVMLLFSLSASYHTVICERC